jgi:hypothetical protein
MQCTMHPINRYPRCIAAILYVCIMEVLGSELCGVNDYPDLRHIVGFLNHKVNIEIINQLGINLFLPNPFQFSIPLSTFYQVYILRARQISQRDYEVWGVSVSVGRTTIFKCIYFHLKMVVQPKHVTDTLDKIVKTIELDKR